MHLVPNYGIHWTSSGVAYLQQGRGGTNALGLKEKSPFSVRLPNNKVHCNHQINIATPVPNDYHWNFFTTAMRDPLVWEAIPTPKEAREAVFVQDDEKKLPLYLIDLSRMSSPIYNCVVPIWYAQKQTLLDELNSTNVQPLIITEVEAKHSALVQDLCNASLYQPRKLIISGKSDVVLPPSCRRVQTKVNQFDIHDFTAIPWEAIGATVVKKYMRHEWIKNPEEGSYVEAKAVPRTPDATRLSGR
jgi:hypothetical protein